jgi:polysaccharide pyruvyl transferase CsaB
MSEIRAVLSGYYGKGNGGDEALLASMLEMLPDTVKPIVLSANPQMTSTIYGVESFDRMNSTDVLQALKRSQVLLLGGGSLIQDATSLRNSVYYGGLIGGAQQLGLKTIALAQGIGPINSGITRWIAKRAFGACAAVSVRDPASAFLLSDWGISSVMAPDPVWSMTGLPVPEVAAFNSPKIAVTLRSHPLLTTRLVDRLAQAVASLQAATGACILIIPFQLSTDLEIAQQIRSRLNENSHILNIVDPRQLKGVFQGIDLAIGMRYHSLIMAAAEGCKCWAISYDPKVSKLMTEINIPGWDLKELPADAASMAAQWQAHLETGANLDRTAIDEIATKSRTHRDLLLAALESG